MDLQPAIIIHVYTHGLTTRHQYTCVYTYMKHALFKNSFIPR